MTIGDFALFEHNVGDGILIGDGGAGTIDYYASFMIGDFAYFYNNSALAFGKDGYGGAFYLVRRASRSRHRGRVLEIVDAQY